MVYYGGSELYHSCLVLIEVYFTPLYLQNVRSFGIIESAALLLPLVLSQVLTTVISGYVIKWTGHARNSFLAGFVVWLAGQGAQLSFDRHTSRGVIIGCLLVQGLGIGATIQSSESERSMRQQLRLRFSLGSSVRSVGGQSCDHWGPEVSALGCSTKQALI